MREALRGNLVSAGSWLVNCSCGSFTAGAAQQRKSEKESSGNGGGDLFKQRQRPWVGTLWMVSVLTYLLTISFVTIGNVLHAYKFCFPG